MMAMAANDAFSMVKLPVPSLIGEPASTSEVASTIERLLLMSAQGPGFRLSGGRLVEVSFQLATSKNHGFRQCPVQT
jgi:hypothetical protein